MDISPNVPVSFPLIFEPNESQLSSISHILFSLAILDIASASKGFPSAWAIIITFVFFVIAFFNFLILTSKPGYSTSINTGIN